MRVVAGGNVDVGGARIGFTLDRRAARRRSDGDRADECTPIRGATDAHPPPNDV
jgi:hypothetical protein